MAQAAAVVNVAVGSGTVGSLCPQTVGIVGHAPCGGAIGHGCQFSAMLPGICPCTVRKRIADGVIGNGLAVIACQQVAPVRITVGIGNRIQCRAQSACGVGILLPGEDVAGIVISPSPGLSGLLVILPGQLVGSIIGMLWERVFARLL